MKSKTNKNKQIMRIVLENISQGAPPEHIWKKDVAHVFEVDGPI
jgi:hypothetical protein